MANITLDKNINDEFAKYAEKTVLSELVLSDNYIIDLYLLKDIFLGAILLFIKTDEDYQKMFKAIPEYSKRYYNDMNKCFPELKHLTKQVYDVLHSNDVKLHDQIFLRSPITTFVRTLQKQMLVNVNHSAVAGKRDKINFMINTYPLYLSNEAKAIIGRTLSNEYGVTVRVDRIDPAIVEVDFLKAYDEIYTFHIKELLANVHINAALSSGTFFDKKIFAAAVYGYKPVKEDAERATTIIEGWISLLSQFTIIKANKLIPFIQT